MKKTVFYSKPLLILLCIMFVISVAGCGGDDGMDGAVALINGYTTSLPKDIRAPANANFFGFRIEAMGDRFGYRVGYAIVENGVRTDTIVYSYTPTGVDDFKITNCSFILAGNFFEGNLRLQHMQSGDGWSYTGDTVTLEINPLSGYTILTRRSDFEATLLIGDDLVLACAIGSADNETLRPTSLEIFDGYRTIDEALVNPAKADRPFLLIFYISAGA